MRVSYVNMSKDFTDYLVVNRHELPWMKLQKLFDDYYTNIRINIDNLLNEKLMYKILFQIDKRIVINNGENASFVSFDHPNQTIAEYNDTLTMVIKNTIKSKSKIINSSSFTMKKNSIFIIISCYYDEHLESFLNNINIDRSSKIMVVCFISPEIHKICNLKKPIELILFCSLNDIPINTPILHPYKH